MGGRQLEFPTAAALMSGPLGGWLSEQATMREDAKRQSSQRLRLAMAILIPACVALIVFLPNDGEGKFAFSFFALAAGYHWSQGPKRKAVKLVKTGINEALAGALGLTYCHDCEEGEEFALAEAYGLLPSYDRCTLEDRWDGAVAGHAFSLHEAHLEERQGSGKNRRWVTVFRGSIIRVAFSERFHGTTLLARAGRFSSFFGGQKESVELGGEILDAAQMVSPDFEDAFDVYTTDQTEARWIVHPEYIERLIAIEQAFAGEDIAALFTGGAVTIVLASGNLFESGSIDPAEDELKLDETIGQFQRLSDLALTLNTQARIQA
jgi:hypothetical protein